MIDSDTPAARIEVIDALLVLPQANLQTKVLVQQLGATTFKLWSYPFLAESVGVRDVIEAKVLDGVDPVSGLDRIELLRVSIRAGWATYDVLCPPGLAEHPDFHTCVLRVQAAGGFTERLGDLHVFYWPPHLQLKPNEWLRHLQGTECRLTPRSS